MEEEVKQNPGLTGSIPPVVAPFGASTAAAEPGADGGAAPAAPKPAATIRLKPVIRRPMIRKPGTPAPAAPATPSPAADPVQAAKKATGTLKSITGPIPAQAVLKKTGIIAESGVAEGILTPVQAQAAKSKTSRISLESAIGVAPVASSPAPMKTIRLRRPTDLKAPSAPKISPPAESTVASAAPTAAAPVEDASTAVTMEPVAPLPTTPSPSPESTVTQKKTLKLHRPGVSLKKPTIGVGTGATSPSDAAPASGDVPDIADIPDIPTIGTANFGAVSEKKKSSGGGIAAAITSVAAVAALAVLGFCTFKLYTETNGPGGIANGIISANEY